MVAVRVLSEAAVRRVLRAGAVGPGVAHHVPAVVVGLAVLPGRVRQAEAVPHLVADHGDVRVHAHGGSQVVDQVFEVPSSVMNRAPPYAQQSSVWLNTMFTPAFVEKSTNGSAAAMQSTASLLRSADELT